MSRSRLVFVALASTALYADDAPTLTTIVLHDAGNTVPAAPYLRHITTAAINRDEALTAAQALLARSSIEPAQPVSLAAFFPIQSQRLRPGSPSRKRIAQLPVPIFVIGMDAASLSWLEASFEELRALGAQGVVVEAANFDDYDTLRRQTLSRGVVLDVTPGDAIAEGFGISTYPTLLVGE